MGKSSDSFKTNQRYTKLLTVNTSLTPLFDCFLSYDRDVSQVLVLVLGYPTILRLSSRELVTLFENYKEISPRFQHSTILQRPSMFGVKKNVKFKKILRWMLANNY